MNDIKYKLIFISKQLTRSVDNVATVDWHKKQYKRPGGLTSSAAALNLGPEIQPSEHIIEKQIKVPPISMESIWWPKRLGN